MNQYFNNSFFLKKEIFKMLHTKNLCLAFEKKFSSKLIILTFSKIYILSNILLVMKELIKIIFLHNVNEIIYYKFCF